MLIPISERKLPFTDDCRMPFAIDNGCGLGIVTYTYLEQAEIAAEPGKPPSDQLKEWVKKQKKDDDMKFAFFKHVDVGENLETAFGIWDAVGPYFTRGCTPADIM
jgi:hypothetical protein